MANKSWMLADGEDATEELVGVDFAALNAKAIASKAAKLVVQGKKRADDV